MAHGPLRVAVWMSALLLMELAVGGLDVATAVAQDSPERPVLVQRARSLSAAIEAAAPLSARMEDMRDALSSGAGG